MPRLRRFHPDNRHARMLGRLVNTRTLLAMGATTWARSASLKWSNHSTQITVFGANVTGSHARSSYRRLVVDETSVELTKSVV